MLRKRPPAATAPTLLASFSVPPDTAEVSHWRCCGASNNRAIADNLVFFHRQATAEVFHWQRTVASKRQIVGLVTRAPNTATGETTWRRSVTNGSASIAGIVKTAADNRRSDSTCIVQLFNSDREGIARLVVTADH
jgi:hypothetical protein